MPSRLWEGSQSSNGFVSSSHSWHQRGGRANGKQSDRKQPTPLELEKQSPDVESATTSMRPFDKAVNLQLSPEGPRTHGGGARRPRTPRSESAIQDGRKFLAAFREKRRNSIVHHGSGSGGSSAQGSPAVKPSHKRSIDSLEVPPGLANVFKQRLDRYQSCAPGLARSLEAALDASMFGEDGSGEAGDGDTYDCNRAAVEEGADQKQNHPNHRSVGRSSSSELLSDGGSTGELGGALQDAAAAAAAAAATAGEPFLATNLSSSPQQPTPEMLRKATRTSQAAFLSTVLPAETLSMDTGDLAVSSLPITPKQEHWSSAVNSIPDPRQEVRRGGSGVGSASVSGDDASAADIDAMARWASLRRLQDQTAGLGSAAQHQLSRSLAVCRDLRGSKPGARGSGGGAISGHERTSWLDALQSSLHGLEEVLSKRSEVDTATRCEVEALGGPAVLANILNHGAAVGGGAAPAETSPTSIGGAGAKAGWLSGAQLRAFEEKIQARSAMEIAALESERRKLRSKVEMFQRQVQFLQREGPGQSPLATRDVRSGVGSPAANGDYSSALAGEKRFADLLDARLGEERHAQATLEAELASLRGMLEEKDGLIDALREALRSTATPPNSTGSGGSGGGTEVETEVETGGNTLQVAADENTSSSHFVMHGRAVRGRGIFAPSEGRSRSRYHSRSSRLLGVSGPVAMAEAEAAAAIVARREASNRGETQDGVSAPRLSSGDETGVAPVRPDPDAEDAAALLPGSESGVGGADPEEALAEPSGGRVAGSAAAATAVVSGGGAPPAGSASSSERTLPPDGGTPEGEGGNGIRIVSQAKAVTGTALRVLLGSARVLGSRVGLDGGSEAPIASRRRENNVSHAVLIL